MTDNDVTSSSLTGTRKRVLLITKAFFPEIGPRSFRATELAIEFMRQGHEVTILLPANGYDYSLFLKQNSVYGNEIRMKSLGPLKFKDITIERGSKWLFFKRAIRRLLHLLAEYPDIELMFKVFRIIKNECGYDLMISIATPHPVHWGTALARTKKNQISRTWVADCGDPYMGDRMDSFRKMFYFRYIEKWFCRKTDYISVPFEGAVEAYSSEFHDKIRIIPQGFRLKDLKLPEYIKTSPIPRFAYTGTIIPRKRDPSPLMEYLVKSDRDFEFVVFTGQADLIDPFIKKLGKKLVVHSLIGRKELLKILSQMDFLINLDNNIPFQLPSKLIDYAISNRPVLNIRDRNDLVLVDQFMDGDYSGKMNLKDPDYFDIESVTKKFLALA